jgi:prolyl-tRNA synthetase
MNLMFIDVDNTKKPVVMGCYGIGISRLIMAILEQHNTDLKVLWPETVAPFKVHVIPMDKVGSDGYIIANDIYEELKKKYEVLIDDRSESAGVKFNDADLIGIKYRIIVGRRAKEGVVEVKNMETLETKEMSIDEVKGMVF